ncbi:MAG: type II toxin-antitoxin system VapC family toxin [Armatimonadetes bacterium]|nr:type II toxin-antitoxin system VapC family toxin [Armatimonadota bacterium]
MRFWDSSAIVPLFIEQAATERMRSQFAEDPQVLAWTMSDVEFRSAICRLLREGAIEGTGADTAMGEFRRFWSGVRVLSAVEPVKERAMRLLGVHALRAADSLQLAAALVAAYDRPSNLEFVALDLRLVEAARREGFVTVV